MAWYMAVLVAYSFYKAGFEWSQLLVACAVVGLGAVGDYGLHLLQSTGRNKFPKSGFISSLIILVLLPSGIEFLPALSAVLLAIGSKHFLLYNRRHIFNPAAFGVAVSALVFGFSLGWRADVFIWLVWLLGLMVIYRVRKQWQVVAFLAMYLGYLTLTGGFSVFIALGAADLAPWFFALFMLTEPMTSPVGTGKGIIFGAAVGMFTILFSLLPFVAEVALPLGLLTGNLLRLVLKHPNSVLKSNTQFP